MLTTPDPSKMVWNHCPYWGSFLSMNNSWFGCMAALGVRKQLGHSVPVWNWLLWTCLSGILDFGSLYLTYFVFIWVCSKQGCPPFRAEQIPLPKKHQSVLYTHYLCVHVWFLDWKGSKRERKKGCCVCKVSTHSHERMSDEEVSEKDKSHDFSYLWHLTKWANL